ncbi:protein kinase and helix-hairpin-helix DNA-binding domain-containing protein [Pseudomonas cuatrocienegasensis]|uniref:Protein kinase and helix-hairpin-helix DNA-binding domain-containing protein n=1 Tax=Pseudomonas cuatrocienegasensis TaxID=543360 RepID=A0ABY1BE08_9PSED|nr:MULTISPECIES: topoisomerase DNA-binding C4 zinc finger domain-containing protein [Pseudomonas]SEQ63713.1 protein kinase and helix-hairpin-helix DNA-binding domain-containing protein [Pseudomonas cuatrocienegasensis]
MSAASIRIAGKSADLGKRLGRGGEGDVYAISGLPDQAVKVYKENLRGSRETKVRAMVEGRLSEKSSLVAFPVAVVTDDSGAFAGFTMRLVSGFRPIHELYSPKSRKIQFPKADYRFLIRTAQNVARAVATVHQAGCVIGDFNHSGVLVATDATAALIDADSFQFNLNGRSFPCVVGTEDFTPPELHGINLSQVERTRAHDNFGLAVAIFQLLAMGKHPYSGRYSGEDLSLGQAIAQHRFAYSVARRSATRTTPPPGSIQLTDFPQSIALAFEAAFGLDPSNRPDPGIWVKLLNELETSLRRCSKFSSHYFPHVASSCVWCRITEQSGVEMFPVDFTAGKVSGDISDDLSFDLSKIAAAIRAAPLPRPDDILPTRIGDLGAQLPIIQKAQNKRKRQRFLGGAIALTAFFAFLALPEGVAVWGMLGLFGLSLLMTAKIDTAPLLKVYIDADNRVREASLTHLQRVGFTEIFHLRNELESCIAKYQQLEAGLTHALERLKTTREARQRHAFLDRFLLSRVRISGIGPAKMAALASFGIESAADINYQAVMTVPGFGEALTRKLLQWRRDHEAKFRYNPAYDPADQRDEDTLRATASTERAALQAKLRSGLAALQNAPSRLAANKNLPALPLMQALTDRARAERDCAALGIKTPPHGSINPPIPRPAAPTQPFHTQYQKPVPQPQRQQIKPQAALPHQQVRSSAGQGAASPVSCPVCRSPMVKRMAKKGRNAGKHFWGCSCYPRCKGTRN